MKITYFLWEMMYKKTKKIFGSSLHIMEAKLLQNRQPPNNT